MAFWKLGFVLTANTRAFGQIADFKIKKISIMYNIFHGKIFFVISSLGFIYQ